MSDTDTDTGEYLSVEQFEEYLQTTLAASTNEEVLYLRTNVVADELGLSRQQVGQLFMRHKSRSQTFDIDAARKAIGQDKDRNGNSSGMNHGSLTPSSATCVARPLPPTKHSTAIGNAINPSVATASRDPVRGTSLPRARQHAIPEFCSPYWPSPASLTASSQLTPHDTTDW
jgi:hypothetical protein